MQPIIQPIDTAQRLEVTERTHQFIRRAENIYGERFDLIPVRFNLTGTAAGMYRVQNDRPEFRYNPHLFAKYFAENLSETVPHEVSHYIVHTMYGTKARPHGPEWKQVMRDFGAKPVRTCNFDLSGIPVRRHRRFEYQCGCRMHSVTTRVHNMISTGTRQYFCKSCARELVIA
ncbi:MAG: SprT-like domain-containing protein [Gammaproteobacteria bacterium]|nr:SprT-like domain-containing protein [Gammaproteobacteria bacterium]